MKVLVTGGAGYIGSHVCKALARAGFEPVAYDNLSRGFAYAVKWGPLEQGELVDGDRLDAVFKAYAPVAVIHFAAFTYVGESVADPALYFRNNVVGTLSLLDAMRRNGVKPIVFSSTAAVYGEPEQVPITEDAPKQPVNPYGVSKLMVEQLLADYGRAYGMAWTALRYFNAAGADPDGEIGENHDPETHAIPLAIDAAIGRRENFGVFGDDYATPDGSAIRDYIHVADLAEAHVLALKYLLAGGESAAMNLGLGQGTSVFEICAAVERATGRTLPMRRVGRRAGDPPVLVASPERAMKTLNWTPRHLDIDEIVRHAAAWAQRSDRA
jgi:UDP-arabinose 4-epimerase